MVALCIFELLLDGLFADWEQLKWTIASSICDSVAKALRN